MRDIAKKKNTCGSEQKGVKSHGQGGITVERIAPEDAVKAIAETGADPEENTGEIEVLTGRRNSADKSTAGKCKQERNDFLKSEGFFE